MLVRLALKTDLSRILSIERESYPFPWEENQFYEVLEHPEQDLFVLENKGRIEGYLVCWPVLNEVHILNICVEPEAQGQGCGRKLLEFCFSHYASHDHFFLEVRESNTKAIELYKHFGFKETYVRSRYYPDGEDALVMVHKK